jgi:Zn-dependent protease with chaperone function
MTTAAGLFFDGISSARHAVTAEATADGVCIRNTDGSPIADWPYASLRAMSSPDDVLRLGNASGPELARLELRDAALIAEIEKHAESLDRKGATERRLRKRAILWSIAATASLVLVALFGLPLLASQIAPHVPLSVERRLGAAIDSQARSMLDKGHGDKPFECGAANAEKAGRAAIGTLIGRLEHAAALPIPLTATVIRRRESNAIALPGGHIYVFEGLVTKARSADEVAGVIAHEIGHVAHRDGTRSLLEAAGLSFLFGMLLGDFTGGGLAVVAARTVLQSAYSREVEAAADLYSVGLMGKIGGDPRALGTILERIAGQVEPGSDLLKDHPQTKDRIAAINAAAAASSATHQPVLTSAEWAALKRICG